MARASKTDFLHSMRFHVTATTSNGFNPFADASAGFSTCSTPEITVEAVEYKEGHYIYKRKQTGDVSVSDITMARGVTLTDTAFYDWAIKAVEGTGQVRTDLLIRHFHRDALPGAQGAGNPNATTIDREAKNARIYHVMEALPIRCKIAADLDATASDISISEIDVSYENFYITNDVSPT